jgi:hypothetical protein
LTSAESFAAVTVDDSQGYVGSEWATVGRRQTVSATFDIAKALARRRRVAKEKGRKACDESAACAAVPKENYCVLSIHNAILKREIGVQYTMQY